MKYLLVVLFGLPWLTSQAQPSDSVRTRYVESFREYFFIWPLIKQRTTTFEVKRSDNRGQGLTFRPNNAFTAGLGFYLFELGFEVTLAVPVDQKKTSLYGTSKALDIQVNILSKHWGADVFYQRYRGFYLIDPTVSIPDGQPLPQRPDLVTENVGLNGIYFFNKKKFSFRSAYNFAERQRKSAGSFLFAGTLNSYELRTDSSLYGGKYEPLYGKASDVTRYRTTTFSISPGYSYTVVLKNFFLNASLSVGPALHFISYEAVGVAGDLQKVNAFSDFRIGMGYNGKRFFSGVTFVAQSRYVKFNEVQFTAASSTVRILAGYRFREVGILKWRALDIFTRKRDN